MKPSYWKLGINSLCKYEDRERFERYGIKEIEPLFSELDLRKAIAETRNDCLSLLEQIHYKMKYHNVTNVEYQKWFSIYGKNILEQYRAFFVERSKASEVEKK